MSYALLCDGERRTKLKKGDIIEIDIDSSGMNGEGVARYDGLVIFVPFTLIGEKVRAQVLNVKKTYSNARVIKVLKSSELRVKPECENFFKCGGCDMMHITLDEERRIKINEIENNLLKIGGISRTVDNFIDSPLELGYRNKAQFPFGRDMDGNIAVGYFKPNSHIFVPCAECLLVGDFVKPIVDIVLKFCNSEGLSIYDERTYNGLLRHLVIRKVNDNIAVTLVINGDSVKNIDRLADELPPEISLYTNVNKARTNVILGKDYRLIKGEMNLPCNVLGVKAKLAPDAFMQINDGIRDLLYTRAIQLMGDGVAVDLYSGIGITTNLLAQKCDKVYSIEIIESACENARETACLNENMSKIEVICGDAAVEMPKLAKRIKGEISVLLDPPRKGVDENVLTALLTLNPSKIVYISCNHATMARDIALINSLSADQYTISELNAYNMFPRTHHVETLACLEKKS